jgi:uncharacterized OsmC-like protein
MDQEKKEGAIMYKVDITNSGSSSFTVTSGNQTCTIDTKAGGMTPPGMLLAGLGSCIGVYIQKYADGAKLGLGAFDIGIEADFAKEAPLRFQEIRVSIRLNGVQLDERRKAALLSFITNCPVHNTLETHPTVTMTLS